MIEANAGAIIATIERAYGSLSNPSYSFVDRALAAKPYAVLIHCLGLLVDVEETTDVNGDVSFRYVLAQGEESWALNLSMVGPYGLLMRLSREGSHEVVTGESDAEGSVEADLLAAIDDGGISLLTREVLQRAIPLRRPGDEDRQSLVYHALIGDDPLLPW